MPPGKTYHVHTIQIMLDKKNRYQDQQRSQAYLSGGAKWKNLPEPVPPPLTPGGYATDQDKTKFIVIATPRV